MVYSTGIATRELRQTQSRVSQMSSLASTSLITSCSWQTLSTLSSDHLPILIILQMKTNTTPGLRRTYVNLKKDNWDRYRQEVEDALSKRSLPTDCQRDEKIFRTVLLKAASVVTTSLFQRLPPARGGTAQKKIIHLANWSVVLSAHSMTLAGGGSPMFPLVVHQPASPSICAVTPAGSVHKSRGDNVVHMWVQLKR